MKKLSTTFFFTIFVVTVLFPQSKNYKIGYIGPGGGIIFAVEGESYSEVSRLLGGYSWDEAVKAAKNYRGGDFKNWYLPSVTELKLVYDNLVKTNIMSMGNTWYWSSAKSDKNAILVHLGDGNQLIFQKNDTNAVSVIRKFKIKTTRKEKIANNRKTPFYLPD
ncbi:hypothetical protein AGMMS50212_05330 [Spirochaetia bacterium]|nr:hypothetical protein AGMMS50212_05330 [Spirochaetia bacterium]